MAFNSLLRSYCCRTVLNIASIRTGVLSCSASYAKGAGALGTSKAGKILAGAVPERKRLDVETDPEKLTQYVSGSNIFKEGSDVKLRPHSEYPDWLWTLRTENKAPELDELDRNSWQYWMKLNKMNRKQYNVIMKNKYRYQKF